MFIFFFVNIFFLTLLFFVHRGLFLIGMGINILLYILALLFRSHIQDWLGSSFAFWLALTGVSFIIIFIFFFVAIFSNKKYLDPHYNK
ncbi:hypothetical protein CSB09_00120 [Candidatus Gracilibacteria bacterium]|nr:MAG: hypothetical protein CSB09_00120 [Candidatus Gracilibacteria bacterium]